MMCITDNSVSSSKNFRIYDGDIIRKTIITRYVELLSGYSNNSTKYHLTQLDRFKRDSFEILQDILSSQVTTLSVVKKKLASDKTGSFKFDLYGAFICLADIDASCIPIEVELDKSNSFVSDVIKNGLTNIKSKMKISNKSNKVYGDDGQEIKFQQIEIDAISAIDINLLEKNYKAILIYLSSIRNSLRIIKLIRAKKNNGLCSNNALYCPAESLYRFMTACWIVDRNNYFIRQNGGGNKDRLVQERAFMNDNVFVQNGYFLPQDKSCNTYYTAMDNILFSSINYVSNYFKIDRDNRLNNNIFRKALDEMEIYMKSSFERDNKFSVADYKTDKYKPFRDFYILVTNTKDMGNGNVNVEIFNQIVNNDIEMDNLTFNSILVSVLGKLFNIPKVQVVDGKVIGNKYPIKGFAGDDNVIPLWEKIPESKFDKDFIMNTKTFSEWFHKEENDKPEGYDIPLYKSGYVDFNIDNSKYDNPCFTKMKVFDDLGNGIKKLEARDVMLLIRHLSVIEKITGKSHIKDKYTMKNVFNFKKLQLDEYEMYTKLDPSIEDLIVKQIDSECNLDIGKFSLYRTPTESESTLRMLRGIDRIPLSMVNKVLEDNVVLSKVINVSSAMKSLKDDYSSELIVQYIEYCNDCWKKEKWSIQESKDLYELFLKIKNNCKFESNIYNMNSKLNIFYTLSYPLVFNNMYGGVINSKYRIPVINTYDDNDYKYTVDISQKDMFMVRLITKKNVNVFLFLTVSNVGDCKFMLQIPTPAKEFIEKHGSHTKNVNYLIDNNISLVLEEYNTENTIFLL